MIDYLTTLQKEYSGGIEGLKKLGLRLEEVQTKRSSFCIANLSNMKIEYYPETRSLKLVGSPHFYFNEGLHNYNDFTRLDLYDTLSEICTRTGINPLVATLHGFEFGVNVEVSLPPQTIINRILCKGHLTIEPTEGGYYLGKKDGHARFKIYPKHRTEQPNNYFLRVEVHVNKMAWFKSRKIDVSTLGSLFKTETLKRLGEILIEELAEVNFYEEVNRNIMPKKDLAFYDHVTVRSAWEELDFTKRKRQRDRYQRIVEKYSSGNSLSSYLLKLVSDKWNELMVVPPPLKKCYVSTEWESENGIKEKCYVSTEWETTEPTTGNVMFLPLDIDGRNITLKKGGVRGEFQKVGATDADKNEPVLRVRKCSNCREWMEEDKPYCSDKCKHQHDNRNNRTNPPHTLKRRLERIKNNGGCLFNPFDTVRLTTQQREQLTYFIDKNDHFIEENSRFFADL